MENLQTGKPQLCIEVLGQLRDAGSKIKDSINVLEIEQIRDQLIRGFKKDETDFFIKKFRFQEKIRLLNFANKFPHLLDAVKLDL